MKLTNQQTKQIIELNKEIATATPERQREIQQEILKFLPEDVKIANQKTSELTETLKRLKSKMEDLVKCTEKKDFEVFFSQIEKLHQEVVDYASLLGVSLPLVDIQQVRKKFTEQFDNENK